MKCVNVLMSPNPEGPTSRPATEGILSDFDVSIPWKKNPDVQIDRRILEIDYLDVEY